MVPTAEFTERNRCLSCGSSVRELSSGSFEENPLHEFIANNPWGESPVPFLRGCRWEFVQCEQCELAFHRRILSPEWNSYRFEKWMTAEAMAEFEQRIDTPRRIFDRATHFTQHALQLEKLTRSLRGGEPLRVLDFGCGNGRFIQQCSLYGFDAVGVDRSYARREKNVNPIYADVKDITGRQFHAVTLFEVLEHLDDPSSVLESLIPHFVPGGILIVETPDCSGVTGIRSAYDFSMIDPLDHINGFTPGTLKRFCMRLGFVPVAPPTSHVTADFARVARTELKRLLSFAVPARTQQYFRIGPAEPVPIGAH